MALCLAPLAAAAAAAMTTLCPAGPQPGCPTTAAAATQACAPALERQVPPAAVPRAPGA